MYQRYALPSLDRWFFRNPIRCWSTLTCLAPAASLTAHHAQAFHQHGAVGCGQLVPIQLAGIRHEAAHLRIVLGAVGHERQFVRGVELACPDRRDRDQAAWGGLLVQHFGPAVVGKNPLDKVLAQGQVVEPSLLLQWQQGKAVHDFAGEHAGAISLRHAMLIIYFHTKQAGTWRILLIRLDTNDKRPSCLRTGRLFCLEGRPSNTDGSTTINCMQPSNSWLPFALEKRGI